MPANEVLEFYNLKGFSGKLIYGFRFVWRFFLDKLAFFCFVKSWRTAIHRWRGVNIGKGVYIGHEVMFDRVFTDQIYIGDHTSVGDRTIITAHANIPSDTPLKKLYPRKVMPTKIGKGVWIMPAVIIAPGVTVGDESVIATGSVVTKDVPPRTMVAGVPAKVVKELGEDLERNKN
ncbi:MAG: acyltransferase [Bacteroidales bacterium]|jgi:acetyltransferase-like isoleucine patch superfamily enzyme|nr:acyltransferase [Bacteroidales bacterium]